jgi:hypothetical protein
VTALEVAVPTPEFTVLRVTPEPLAATPFLRFEVEIEDESGREVYTIALSAQVRIDADRRAYDLETREALLDIFGEADRIPETASSFVLARVDTLVPSFTGRGTFTLDVPCTGDLEEAAARYLNSLVDGAVPLTFQFNGTIFYCDEHDRLQLTPVPWSCEAHYRFRISVWRELIERRHAGSGFVRLQHDTLERLRRFRAAAGLPTFDSAIASLLRQDGYD